MGNVNESRGLYYLEGPHTSSITSFQNKNTCCVFKVTWNNRQGHPDVQSLNVLKDILSFGFESLPLCDMFHKAKQSRNYFHLSEHKSFSLEELAHQDVWGSNKFATMDGFRYIFFFYFYG